MKILLAESSLRHQIPIADFLRLQGHSVHIVGNGVEAVQRARDCVFDLVFLDLDLPLLDSASAVRWIRQEYAGCAQEGQSWIRHSPWIVGLCSPDSLTLRRSLADDLDAVLSKPVSLSQLQQVIDSLVRGQLGSEGDEPCLEEGKVQELMSVEPGDGFLAELAQLFSERGRQLLSTISHAYHSGDRQELMTAIHDLKGASLTIGAGPLARACIALEQAASVSVAKVEFVIQEFTKAERGIWSVVSQCSATPSEDLRQRREVTT